MVQRASNRPLFAPAQRPAGRRMNMAENKELFEEGVVIAGVIADEKDINQEALEHLETMGKGDEE